jgi:hypothetical protein
MQHFDPYSQEELNKLHLNEIQQWAARERLARQARAGQPSLLSRIGVAVRRAMTLLRQLNGGQRIAHNHNVGEARSFIPKLAGDAPVSEGGHEGC